ncbi:MAG: isoprenylcysteine carboxylmethyltransferase family protein [Planctomycetes bacterium]|nr:isoprenylcysteine carboxylmethyltransferase family protein [Planctomycetota bacterium]
MNLSKASVLLYGSLIYVLFLATYLYCMGFVTGLVVPQHIDTVHGAAPSLAQALAVNMGILSLFAVQHTIMARNWFKKWITRYIPKAAERSTFVLATCAILCSMFVFWQPMPTNIWHVDNELLRNILNGVSLAGFLGVVYVTFVIDHFHLFGLKQVVQNFRGTKEVATPFQVKSVYRISRHPMYFCMFFAFWAAPTMSAGRLLFALICTAYIWVGVRFEEHSLEQAHGQDYRDYKKHLPMIIPSFGKVMDRVEAGQPVQRAN